MSEILQYRLVNGSSLYAKGDVDHPSSVQTISGRAEVVAMRPMLIELGRRTGQPHAMDRLEYFLNSPTALMKTPRLVLVGLRPGVEAAKASADDVEGAVVVHEYRIGSFHTRIYATDDAAGTRTVIAPQQIRASVAAAACHHLVEDGALVALVSVGGKLPTEGLSSWTAGRTRNLVASRHRSSPRFLKLEPTIAATLATLGSNTRRNFVRYKRSAERDLGATFVPEVAMSRDEFLAMNRMSMNPASHAEAAWRYDYLFETSGTLFAGIRASDGRWLSLIGGRRVPGSAKIEWQANLAGFPQYSLSTVMRAYLLEYEISLGTERLVFEGGTPHAMRHSFVSVDFTDIVVRRAGLLSWLLQRFAHRIFPEKNFLGNLLQDPELMWSPGDTSSSGSPREGLTADR